MYTCLLRATEASDPARSGCKRRSLKSIAENLLQALHRCYRYHTAMACILVDFHIAIGYLSRKIYSPVSPNRNARISHNSPIGFSTLVAMPCYASFGAGLGSLSDHEHLILSLPLCRSIDYYDALDTHTCHAPEIGRSFGPLSSNIFRAQAGL